jgi:hypothetical protein
MRLTVDDMNSTDPEKQFAAMNAVIYLDGVPVHGCTIADEEAGYVERWVIDEQGHALMAGDTIATERAYGVVKIDTPTFMYATE